MLYKVEFTLKVYVIAENNKEAQRIAYDNAMSELASITPDEGAATELASIDGLGEWADAIPYGGDGFETCRELFAGQ